MGARGGHASRDFRGAGGPRADAAAGPFTRRFGCSEFPQRACAGAGEEDPRAAGCLDSLLTRGSRKFAESRPRESFFCSACPPIGSPARVWGSRREREEMSACSWELTVRSAATISVRCSRNVFSCVGKGSLGVLCILMQGWNLNLYLNLFYSKFV